MLISTDVFNKLIHDSLGNLAVARTLGETDERAKEDFMIMTMQTQSMLLAFHAALESAALDAPEAESDALLEVSRELAQDVVAANLSHSLSGVGAAILERLQPEVGS